MKTLFDKIWDKHVVETLDTSSQVLYIDHHFIHEVTTPQAFNALKSGGYEVFRPHKITAVCDHNVPTSNQHLPITNEASKHQVATLAANCAANNITLYELGHENQGIVHVIGPELGITQPGMTIVCGDSHTSTHGAFGAVAFGIGTSQVAQVLAAQALIVSKPKRMNIVVKGTLQNNVFAKDMILYIIAQLGTAAGAGYFVEFSGEAIKALSMESRMTICNMSIEMGARGGLIAPDEITFNYLQDKLSKLPEGAFQQKLGYWKKLYTDPSAVFDKVYEFNAKDIAPMITYGTHPGMAIPVTGVIPASTSLSEEKALKYMGFKAGDHIVNTKINYVFIGSCTNARIEDFRAVANVVKGKSKAENVTAYLVPGSNKVLAQIHEEGLVKIFTAAGFEIRQPGCSACLAMNDDKIPAGEYCVSTSNRNFEGRQGQGARTLLTSPAYAAKVAVTGHLVV